MAWVRVRRNSRKIIGSQMVTDSNNFERGELPKKRMWESRALAHGGLVQTAAAWPAAVIDSHEPEEPPAVL